jgi:hypothetical protein
MIHAHGNQEIVFFFRRARKKQKEAPLGAAAFFLLSSILIDFSALMTRRVCYGAVTAPCTWVPGEKVQRFVRDDGPFRYFIIKCWCSEIEAISSCLNAPWADFHHTSTDASSVCY